MKTAMLATTIAVTALGFAEPTATAQTPSDITTGGQAPEAAPTPLEGTPAVDESQLPTEFWNFCTSDPSALEPSVERMMSEGWSLVTCSPYAAQIPGTMAATIGHCCYFER